MLGASAPARPCIGMILAEIKKALNIALLDAGITNVMNIIMAALGTHTKLALGITFTGTTLAETSKTASIVRMDAMTANARTTITITTTIIAIALITHTSFVREIAFTGMILAETSKTFTRPALEQTKFASMASVFIKPRQNHIQLIIKRPVTETMFTGIIPLEL